MTTSSPCDARIEYSLDDTKDECDVRITSLESNPWKPRSPVWYDDPTEPFVAVRTRLEVEPYRNTYPLFAKDVTCRGAKSFHAAPYDYFYKVLSDIEPEARVFHELISPNSPVKMFFDYDFDKMQQPDHVQRFSVLARTITEMAIDFLKAHLSDYTRDRLKHHVHVLNSSGYTKFSEHHIVETRPTMHFNTVQDLRCFVTTFKEVSGAKIKRCMNDFLLQNAGGLGGEQLQGYAKHYRTIHWFVQSKHIDVGVYRGNGTFRCPNCTKLGQRRWLGGRKLMRRAKFLNSLVCYVDPDIGAEFLIKCSSRKRGAQLVAISEAPGEGFARYLFRNHRDIIDDIGLSVKEGFGVRKLKALKEHAIYDYGYTIPTSSHYCRLIGRRHSGNYVTYYVNLRRGVVVEHCLDPECNTPELRRRVNADPRFRIEIPAKCQKKIETVLTSEFLGPWRSKPATTDTKYLNQLL